MVSGARNHRQPDHPRGCGENIAFDGETDKLTRITPADAGKTGDNPTMPPVPEDHPRGCGENFRKARFLLFFRGSPPRMRGKPDDMPAPEMQVRITPADAGKTRRCYATRTKKQDHPRGCGENAQSSDSEDKRPGSPPRMRGKLSFRCFCAPRLWITPADAGKTTEDKAHEHSNQDHPRGCGENCQPIY